MSIASVLSEGTITFELGPGLVAVALALIAVIKTFVTAYQNRKQNEVIKSQVERYIREMRPNGGHSLRDAIDRIEQIATGTQAEVTTLNAKTIGVLAGEQETRRIIEKPVDDRTVQDLRHLLDVPPESSPNA